MKNWVWSAFVLIVTFLIMHFFDIPFWIFLIVVIPLLIIAFTYGSFSYSFRRSLRIEPIPGKGYASRIKALDIEKIKLNNLGFAKTDGFYLKMIPDTIVYVFKHKAEPVHFCLYNLGTKMTCDFVTRYGDEYSLTTCNNVDGGMTPRPERSLLQIITKVTYANLFGIHMKAHNFLVNKGLKTYDIAEEEFHQYFLKCLHSQAKFVREFMFWPVLLVFWTITRRGRVYCKEIETQYKKGLITLYAP